MNVQILGTGCPKCRALEANARQAIEELALDARIEKVETVAEIVAMGVMNTPALAVDGRVLSVGHLLSVHQVKSLLSDDGEVS